MPGKPRSALGGVLAGIILAAGLPSEGRAALSYDITIGAGGEVNDNLHLDPRAASGVDRRQPVKETMVTINPGVILTWEAEYDQLHLNYNGVYSILRGDEAEDPFWVHNVAATLNWRRWTPFFLEAREERSRVPRTQDRAGEAFVDQVDRNLLSVRTGLVSTIGPRSTVELAYRGELDTYDGIADADRVERQYGEMFARHRWNPLWSGELRLTYGQVERKLTEDYGTLSVSLVADQRWSEHLALQYGIEWFREDRDKQAGEGSATAAPAGASRGSLLLEAEIRGDLELGGSWFVAYRDGREDQLDGDTLKTGRASAGAAFRARLDSTLDLGGWHETRDYRESGREEVAWGPTLGVRWMMAPWAAFDLGGSWTDTTIWREDQAKVEDRTTRAAAGLVWLLFKRVQLETGYGYRNNASTDALRSYTNNLLFALLTFHFRPVLPGRLPSSYAAGFVAAGTP